MDDAMSIGFTKSATEPSPAGRRTEDFSRQLHGGVTAFTLS
jgi:hypothetical protein